MRLRPRFSSQIGGEHLQPVSYSEEAMTCWMLRIRMMKRKQTRHRLLPSIFAVFLILHAAEGAAKFEAAKASSTQGTQFEASQALQPGPSYWCSAGSHPDDEQGTVFVMRLKLFAS